MQDNSLEIQYNKMTDDNVVKLIQSGDERALNFIMDKYNNIVNMKASKFFAVGIEKDDIINNEILKESPNLLSLHETIKMSKFICFSKYLVREIILYANNINDMFELKYRAQNLLEIVYDKLDKMQNTLKIEKK